MGGFGGRLVEKLIVDESMYAAEMMKEWLKLVSFIKLVNRHYLEDNSKDEGLTTS